MRYGPIAAIAAVLCLLPMPGLAGDGEIKLRQGARCERSTGDDAGPETHHCFFADGKFRNHDFRTSNGRAQYIFSEMGKCEEIEILGERAHPVPGGDTLHRTSIACTE